SRAHAKGEEPRIARNTRTAGGWRRTSSSKRTLRGRLRTNGLWNLDIRPGSGGRSGTGLRGEVHSPSRTYRSGDFFAGSRRSHSYVASPIHDTFMRRTAVRVSRVSTAVTTADPMVRPTAGGSPF